MKNQNIYPPIFFNFTSLMILALNNVINYLLSFVFDMMGDCNCDLSGTK